MPSLDALHLWDKCGNTMSCESAQITMVVSFAAQRLTAMAYTEQSAQRVCKLTQKELSLGQGPLLMTASLNDGEGSNFIGKCCLG